MVTGNKHSGGLVGDNVLVDEYKTFIGTTTTSFWDKESTGMIISAGGIGMTTADLQNEATFIAAGWDFVNEKENGVREIWQMSEVSGYPILAIPRQLQGNGTSDDPYLISNAEELATVRNNADAHYLLTNSIDLSGIPWTTVVIPYFEGIFNGNGHTISHITIGLFGLLESGAAVMNLGVVDVNVNVTDQYVGGLVGYNRGNIFNCYCTGSVNGGDWIVGGLVGLNDEGIISTSYSNSTVSGNDTVGGLVGINSGSITNSYSTGMVTGEVNLGGFVGISGNQSKIINCFSTGVVIGGNMISGLIGKNLYKSSIITGFWDMETSGQIVSDGGTGKTTAEMQTARTFLEAGWDFVDETENGTEDIWWIDEGEDYPRLWWEPFE
jgi:hypothetical protein